ncbi:MAG: hypothetical protein A2W37_10880 [Chloroflexi bacterium RBG_16_63_12]|jgi:hypothetical protein|nr:hypothetical protein [Anaerolineales bacterium]OGO44999.1 MAG: hypothetical protein A2W37_10880 [Chloroflexi bacterium RBG_16_63_12]
MDILHVLPFVSTAITVAFAGAVLSRYLKGKRLHSLMWGIGLLLYAAGTFSEAYLALGWSDFLLRMWYLSGAMLTAAWLGQGTIYLLVRRPGVAHVLTAILALVSLVAIGAVFTAPVSAAAFHTGVPISTTYKTIMTRSGLIVLLTILLNIYGTITLVGGAIYSAFLFWRKRVLPNRVIGNVFIAAGALMPAAGGTFIKLGLGDWLYLSELLGAAIMFLGFWLATQPQPAEEPTRAAALA